MILQRCPKASPDTGIRTVLPEDTLKRVLPLLKAAGMEPLENITDKDNIGIPVFSISRKTKVEGAVSNYNGKGPTQEQAMASAVMEAMERYSAEQRDDDDVIYGTLKDAEDTGFTLDPKELILPLRVLNYLEGAEIAWTMGFEMLRGEPLWVPAAAVFHPYFPDGDLMIHRYHTNGIAAGNTVEEAILHALLELVERDAWSIAESFEKANADVVIEDGVCAELLNRFENGGVKIHLKDLTSDLGIPTIGAASDDTVSKDPALLSVGVGTHLNPEIAAIRAITEVAQSRTTHKHGVKCNAKLVKINNEMGYDKVKAVNRLWYSPSAKKIKLKDMKRMDTDYVLDDIEVVLQKLVDNGFDKVIAIDLTRPETGIPVVRMIVPGLEVSTMDPEREGLRVQGRW